MGKLTGQLLFLRYAWPCAEYRLHAGLISRTDFDRLKFLIESGETEPEKSFLAKCFPNAVEDMRQFCQKFNKGFPWHINNVREFWRDHHGHKDECSVRLFVISEIRDQDIFVNHNLVAKNLYQLSLKKRDMVFVHRRVVVEKYK